MTWKFHLSTALDEQREVGKTIPRPVYESFGRQSGPPELADISLSAARFPPK